MIQLSSNTRCRDRFHKGLRSRHCTIDFIRAHVGARGQNHLGLDYSPGTLTHSIIDARYLSETQTKSERRRESNTMGLPTLWKFWRRNRPTHKRRVHLGIDYGVSTSKIVFRDCDTPGGGSSVLLLHNGSSRIPSRVCMTGTEL